MESLYLLGVAGAVRFAMPASIVESVVTLGAVVPVPLSPPSIAGVSALRSRVITVVDVVAAIHGGEAALADRLSTIIVTLGGHLYGLVVDDIHDVISHSAEPERFGAALDSGWQRVSTGIIEVEGSAVVVIDPAKLVVDRIALAA